MSDTHQHQEHTHHVTSIGTFVRTFIVLILLMGLTVWSSHWQFKTPLINNAINLGIAVIKATLVVMFFMGLKYSTSLTKIFGLAGFVWLTLMSITFGDYVTRSWEPVQGWYVQDRGIEAAPESTMRNPIASELDKNKVEVGNSGEGGELKHEGQP